MGIEVWPVEFRRSEAIGVESWLIDDQSGAVFGRSFVVPLSFLGAWAGLPIAAGIRLGGDESPCVRRRMRRFDSGSEFNVRCSGCAHRLREAASGVGGSVGGAGGRWNVRSCGRIGAGRCFWALPAAFIGSRSEGDAERGLPEHVFQATIQEPTPASQLSEEVRPTDWIEPADAARVSTDPKRFEP